MKIRPGFHHSILTSLQEKVKSMSEKQKLCAIIFDEMAIQESFSYDHELDCVEGLEDLGSCGKSRFVANHAGVFMV